MTFFFRINQESIQTVLLLVKSFFCFNWYHWFKKREVTLCFEFRLVQFYAVLRHDTHNLCGVFFVCVRFVFVFVFWLIYQNIYSMFFISDKAFVSLQYKTNLHQQSNYCFFFFCLVVRSCMHYTQNQNTTFKIRSCYTQASWEFSSFEQGVTSTKLTRRRWKYPLKNQEADEGTPLQEWKLEALAEIVTIVGKQSSLKS